MLLSCATPCPVLQALSLEQQREFATQVKQGIAMGSAVIAVADIEAVELHAGSIVASATLAARVSQGDVRTVADQQLQAHSCVFRG